MPEFVTDLDNQNLAGRALCSLGVLTVKAWSFCLWPSLLHACYPTR